MYSQIRSELMSRFFSTIRENKYIAQVPTEKQAQFLMMDNIQEVFFGGSAGPGKSSGLLMAALQYVGYSGYRALLLRRTYRDLALPGALMDRSHEWLDRKVHWDEQDKTWTFPSGATLTFGYLDTENDKYRYQGSELQFCGFDELTQFSQTQYEYLFSRLRRLKGVDIPIRMRSASNPGGPGHDWVKERFIIDSPEILLRKKRWFVRALLDDNPYLDKESYKNSLDQLDPVTRQQLRHGDWDVALSGGMFQREWFEALSAAPIQGRHIRYWDLAATVPEKGKDPDFTVGLLLLEHNNYYYVKDVIHIRKHPGEVEQIVMQTAKIDPPNTEIWMEQEPGSAGVNNIMHYAQLLRGLNFRGEKTTGSKIDRAKPVSAAASHHLIKIIIGSWNSSFLNEVVAFPAGAHDDIVDALSGAFNKLSLQKNNNHAGNPNMGYFYGVVGVRA